MNHRKLILGHQYTLNIIFEEYTIFINIRASTRVVFIKMGDCNTTQHGAVHDVTDVVA